MTLVSLSTDMAQNFEASIVKAPHNLSLSPDLDSKGLAALIDQTADEDLMICIAPLETEDTANLPRVERAGRTGEDILKLCETHRAWIAISNVHNQDGVYASLIEKLALDLKKQTKLKLNRVRVVIQICSAGVKIPYHCDFQDHSLWQITGEQTAYIYPRGTDYLSEADLDHQALGQFFSYENADKPDMRSTCHVNLPAGDMISWPFMSPHRIQNGDSVSVALQLEYMTLQSWRKYLGLKLKAILRKKLGLTKIRYSRPSAARVLVNQS